MGQLVVFAFKDESGAGQMRDALVDLQRQHLIQLDDAAVVVRRQDGKVKVKQAHNLVGTGAFGGAFWGMFIGLLFWLPWLGMAIGAAFGALAGIFGDVGIDDKFIDRVGKTIEPGQSALFMLIQDWTEDKVMQELVKYDAQVLQTSLTREDETKLREAFSAQT